MKSIILFFFCLSAGVFMLNAQPKTFSPRGMGGGGALFFPTINPANDNEFYVACDLSALFHSTDFGKSYDQIDFTKLQVFNTSTYEFTNDPLIAYSNFNDGNEGYPVKTDDGGKTWKRIDAYDVNAYGAAYKIVANYNNPNQLLIGAYADIFISNDGGKSFKLIRHASNLGAGIVICGVFWDGNDIYIATNEWIFYSDDGGLGFSVLTTTGMKSGQQIWSFAGAKEAGKIRFACIAANSVYNGIMPWDYNGVGEAVYVMDNADRNWIDKSAGISFLFDNIMYVAMATNDVDKIYIGGNDGLENGPMVLRSENGGDTWVKSFNTENNENIFTGWEGYLGDKRWSWSETCFGISVAPFNSDKVLFSSYSNVHVSDDGGNYWRQAYVNESDQHPILGATPRNKAYHSIGLENTTCWQVFWQDANTMMGCFSDIGGIRSLDAGKTWGFQYSGFEVNSLYRIVKGTNGNIYGACSGIHDMYQSTRLADAQLDVSDFNGKIIYSTDNGTKWSNLHSFNHPVYWLAIDPSNPNRMYASVIHFGGTQGSQMGGIYRTNDLDKLAASTWTKLSNPPLTEGHPATIEVLNDGKVLCTFSGRRNGSGSFTLSSGLFLYDPLLNTWKNMGTKDMNYWTKDVVIYPGDPLQNTWYVGVWSGWGGAPNGLGGLYRTTNRGTNWTKLTASQFDRVTSITFNPQNLKQSYLTTETQGLWVSNNMDAATPSWSLVTSYPYRQPERIFFNPYNLDEMWVSSFGNGMKVGNLTVTGVFDSQVDRYKNLIIQPNPNNGNFNLNFDSANSQTTNVELFDINGCKVFSKQLVIKQGKNSYPFSIKPNKKGIYLIRLATTQTVYTSKLVIE